MDLQAHVTPLHLFGVCSQKQYQIIVSKFKRIQELVGANLH